AVWRRITPTGVGRTERSCPPPSGSTDHPHGRGEDERNTGWSSRPGGSPPRAWGGRGEPARGDPVGRITPTGVGRTVPSPPTGPACSDHPHGRGEDYLQQIKDWRDTGSPPRAWGGRHLRHRRRRGDRITPTGVGRTAPDRSVRARSADHPHGRGED